ncbi:efflux RND transporter permease subunit [Halioxenophilus aromaticivorans]|uniref:Efflux pump membrane transporter n=1 Tax=Halioxenophilus aromaticivorans TaxID=1306992 RepID=A0AAV3U9P9_9ALTE
MSQFFIQRPVFAWVLAIITVLAGVLGINTLPVAQYPDVSPPTVRVSATYSGASAEAVQNSVTTIMEDALTGLDDMLYMTSSSTRGSSSISIVFDENADPNDAQVDVQNKIQRVTTQLPTVVQDQGVTVSRSTSSILMVAGLISKDGQYSTVELADMVENLIQNPVQRTPGVGSINVFGSGYAMRVWLDPFKLSKYALTTADVVSAIEAQNTTVAVGTLGDAPYVEGQQYNLEITAQSQLTTVAEFSDILLKSENNTATVRIKDVGRVELGQETYGRDARFNQYNAAGFGVNLATGANAVDTSRAVRETLSGIENSLPQGVDIVYAFDTSPFVEASIDKVVHTIIEAVVLVFLVLLVFLHNWRATLIPTMAVPVVLMGTFAVLAMVGYSINTLTMFALVLAIGMLVDDAIVVVENVQRLMEEEQLTPLQATQKSMGQIAGALIGTSLVIITVFLPMAFFGGSTGIIYRQFSVTIITAMALSTLVALILSPAMCASFLKPVGDKPSRFFFPSWFNRHFGKLQNVYMTVTQRFLNKAFIALGILALAVAGIVVLFKTIPSSFLPPEDQGELMIIVNLPESSTTDQTLSVVQAVEDYLLTEEADAVDTVFASLGFSFGGSAQNRAMMFVRMKDFSQRAGNDELAASAVVSRTNMHFAMNNRQGQVFMVQPPAIHGLGNSGGFSMYLLDQANNGQSALLAASKELVALAEQDARVTSLRGTEEQTKTAMRIDIDQEKASVFGISLADINSMLSVIYSGREVNDFEMNSELKPVLVQGEAAFRMQPEDINYWHAINRDGEMVPFNAFTTISWDKVPASLDRYGGVSAVEISGSPGTGVSSGDAMVAMEELVAGMDGGYAVAWTGISYQEGLSGSQAPMLYAISVLVVFLALAALYESWSIPFAIMLVVPIGVLGAMLGALLFSQSNDVYFKVGMLATIGLAAKNAILIVEFAVDLQKQGLGLIEATLEAARQRFRPILMTSLTFILGVSPLVWASGAGSGAQNAIGTAVFGGMLASTFVGVLMIPALLVCVQTVFRIRYGKTEEAK